MKTRILLMSLVAVFFLSCSNSENKATQKTAKQLAIEKKVNELVNNPDFRNAIRQHYDPSTLRDGNLYRGAFTINNPVLFAYAFYLPNNKLLICAPQDNNGTITFLPNNKARFTTRSNEPFAAIYDLNSFEPDLSNEADVDKAGTLFANIVTAYQVIDFGFGDTYFPTEAQSSSVFRLNTSVSDSRTIYDDQFNVIGYTPETVRKNLTFRSITVPNSNGNVNFDFQLN